MQLLPRRKVKIHPRREVKGRRGKQVKAKQVKLGKLNGSETRYERESQTDNSSYGISIAKAHQTKAGQARESQNQKNETKLGQAGGRQNKNKSN